MTRQEVIELLNKKASETEEEMGSRFNKGKTEWSLVDFESLVTLARVMMQGKEKYGRENWKKGLLYTEMVESCLRHIFAFLAGEDYDKESGELHLGHMLANSMMLVYMYNNRKDLDDRSIDRTDDIPKAEYEVSNEIENMSKLINS